MPISPTNGQNEPILHKAPRMMDSKALDDTKLDITGVLVIFLNTMVNIVPIFTILPFFLNSKYFTYIKSSC